jgi:putative sigma-54 modulation protein
VKRYRGKLVARSHPTHREVVVAQGFQLPEEEEDTLVGGEVAPRIVKVKQFVAKPMTPEEATLQLELVGHDFFVFTNSESKDTAVVYRRRDGDYGLIEPQQ